MDISVVDIFCVELDHKLLALTGLDKAFTIA